MLHAPDTSGTGLNATHVAARPSNVELHLAESAPAEESARAHTRASGPAGVRGATSGPLITEGFESESFGRLRAAFAGGPAAATHPLFMPPSSSQGRMGATFED